MNKKFQLNNLFTSYAQFCNCAPGADTAPTSTAFRALP